MKTPKTYKFSDTTLVRIAEIEQWLPTDSATNAIEEAVMDFHNRLKLRQQLGEFQAELADLWQRFEKHPHYGVYKDRDGVEIMYNTKESAKWQGRKGVLALDVLQRHEGLYKTAYNLPRLNELASSERWFTP
jgi:hypothetical protein